MAAFGAALRAVRKFGLNNWMPLYLALYAQGWVQAGDTYAALATIDEGIGLAVETGERFALPELLRIKGGVLLTASSPGAAEACLLESLAAARRREALCWELRAAADLARLWQHLGRVPEATALLRTVYDRFTEGFDTPELLEAHELLCKLAMQVGRPGASFC
jgi:predicted ATPase